VWIGDAKSDTKSARIMFSAANPSHSTQPLLSRPAPSAVAARPGHEQSGTGDDRRGGEHDR
jgi:hypothetical protein